MSGNTTIALVLATIAVGALVLPRIVRAQSGPDAQVIDQLRKAGSELSKPHPIEFFLYVPTREAAERLASKLITIKFETKITASPQAAQWLVSATKSMVPDEAELMAIRKVFTALAAVENGEYDGWGTPVVK
jgi:hypothetical protein